MTRTRMSSCSSPRVNSREEVEGETMAKDVIAFTDRERYVVGVTILRRGEAAAALPVPRVWRVRNQRGHRQGKERMP